MKKIFIGLLIMLSVLGCSAPEHEPVTELSIQNDTHSGGVEIWVIDSCEYITWSATYAGNIIHKQNCKYCNKRK